MATSGGAMGARGDEANGQRRPNVTGKASVHQSYVPVQVWDLPTRLFHWAIVLLVGFSWLSQELDWMDWHKLSGYAVLTLLLFRLAWGVVGSETARFRQFLASPRAALRHLADLPRREPDLQVGHNAAGGWMVLVLLLLLAVQVGTGLFANDDVLTEGPLAETVDKSTSDWLSHIHGVNFTLIAIAVAAHVLAVLTYAVLKRHDLVRPMLTGRKRLPADLPPPRMASPWLALLLVVAAAGAVTWLVNRS
jgi:cytochrome b